MNLPDLPPENMTLQATVQQAGQAKPEKNKGSSSNGGSSKEPQGGLADRFSWPGRIALLIALVLSPWFFASVEFQAQRWIAISLLAGLAFWWFETAMNKRRSQVFPYLFFPIVAGLFLGLIQTAELPAALSGLMGRQTDIYQQFMGPPAQTPSISVDRSGTWDQIRLLVIALAAMLLGCRYFRTKRDIYILLTTMVANGVVISFFGIVHKLTDNGKMFWVKEITRGGQPFGPFVNRNNGAGYLLICLACCIGLLPILMSQRKRSGPQTMISKEMPFWRQLSYYFVEFMAELNARKVALLVATVLIGAGVVATLSRGGVIAMLVGGTATILAYGMARQPKNSSFVFIPLGILVALLIGWIGLGDELVKRFERIDLANVSSTDERMKHWKSTSAAIGDFGVLGSGLGSYKGIHRLYREDNERSVFHYAENQFFQAVVEAGWPGLILFLIAWLIAIQCASLALSKGKSPTSIGVGTMGMFLIFSQFTASLFDFGLYIPANMLAVAVMFGFLSYHAQALADRLKESSWLKFQIPNYAVQIVVLMLFGVTCLVSYDLHKLAGIEKLLRPRAKFFDRHSPTGPALQTKITDLMDKIRVKQSPEGLNYAAELWIQRCRQELFVNMKEDPEFIAAIKNLNPEQNQKYLDNLWNLTNLQQLHENIVFLSQESKYRMREFRTQPAIRGTLPQAVQLLKLSRDQSPHQPATHLKIGELNAILGNDVEAAADFERAVALAPGSAAFRNVTAIYYLQSDQPKLAAPHLRKYLTLDPLKFKATMNLLTGRVQRYIRPPSSELIANEIIPDNPKMLYDYAMEYLRAGTPEQAVVLEKTGKVLEAQEYPVHENMVLLGNVRKLQGRIMEARKAYDRAVTLRQSDLSTLYKRALLLVQLEEYELALKDVEILHRRKPNRSTFEVLLSDIKKQIRKRDRKNRPQM